MISIKRREGIRVTGQKILLKCWVAKSSCVLSQVQLFATPWTVAHQAPLSKGISQARILEWAAISLSFWEDGAGWGWGNWGKSLRIKWWDLPGGPVVKNPTCDAGNASLIPGGGTKIPLPRGLLSPYALESMRQNWRALVPPRKSLHDTIKTWCRQINKY